MGATSYFQPMIVARKMQSDAGLSTQVIAHKMNVHGLALTQAGGDLIFTMRKGTTCDVLPISYSII